MVDCDDPQCGDSTWDHACNAGGCDDCGGTGLGPDERARRERINRVKVSKAGAHKMATLSLEDRIAGLRGAARRCRNAYPSEGPWRDACHLLAAAYDEAAEVLAKLQRELEP